MALIIFERCPDLKGIKTQSAHRMRFLGYLNVALI